MAAVITEDICLQNDDVVDNIAGGQQQLVFSDIENETGYFFKSI